MKNNFLDFLLCGLIFSVLFFLSIFGTCFLATHFTKQLLHDYHVLADLFIFLVFCCILSGLLVQILIKISPISPGEYSQDHKIFGQWKLLTMIVTFNRVLGLILPLRPLFLRLFGAKIGSNVAIGGDTDAPYLISIGDNSITGHGSLLSGDMILNGKIVFGKVQIGQNVMIGANAVVLPDVEIGDHAIIEIGSVVYPGTRIPAGEKWRGNPARKWLSN